jgi:hypothetical protein
VTGLAVVDVNSLVCWSAVSMTDKSARPAVSSETMPRANEFLVRGREDGEQSPQRAVGIHALEDAFFKISVVVAHPVRMPRPRRAAGTAVTPNRRRGPMWSPAV